jgi:hypothetical protein
MWKPENLLSAILPLLYISKIVGLAPYSLTSCVQKETGNVIQANNFKSSRFDVIYSFAVLIVYLTTFPFFVMWKISDMYNRPTFVNGSITYIVVDCLSISLQFVTSFLSLCEIALRSRQIIRQTVLDMCQVDVLLGISLTRSVYRKTAAAMVVQVIFWCAVVGILYNFDYELWYKDKNVLYGLSKYETNSIRLVMIIQFVNFVHYVKNRFKMINSEIIRIFGFSDEMELDDYLVRMTHSYLTESQDAGIKQRRRTNIAVTQLNCSDNLKDVLRRQSVCSAVHVLRNVHFKLTHIATSFNTAYQVPIMFEVMAVLTTIALKFHLGLVTIFFENITDSPVTLFLSLNFWWIVLHSSKLVLITSSCQHASRQSARTALILQKVSLLKPLHPDTLIELQLFSQQLLHHDLVFSPCGFFTLNHCFLTSCIESLITYVIILLQFTHAKK